VKGIPYALDTMRSRSHSPGFKGTDGRKPRRTHYFISPREHAEYRNDLDLCDATSVNRTHLYRTFSSFPSLFQSSSSSSLICYVHQRCARRRNGGSPIDRFDVSPREMAMCYPPPTKYPSSNHPNTMAPCKTRVPVAPRNRSSRDPCRRRVRRLLGKRRTTSTFKKLLERR
jgi:hypothetical protein